MRNNVKEAYESALAADPVSAFGGILISNSKIDSDSAESINSLFCEVVISPDFDIEALEILKGKKNRIILKLNSYPQKNKLSRSCLNGTLIQTNDNITDSKEIRTKVLPINFSYTLNKATDSFSCNIDFYFIVKL